MFLNKIFPENSFLRNMKYLTLFVFCFSLNFAFAQNTVNLDLNKFYADTFSGLGVAFGAEYRLENYEITAGEEASYTQYTAEGEAITLSSQTPLLDFFGRSRPGGSQVFPGFGPKNELDRARSSVAAYVDLDAKFSDAFSTTFATRYENYSDFGSTINFKLASRYKITDNFAVRGAVSTGFRAPSLHQRYFNAVATQFVAGIPSEVGTFPNDSDIADKIGIESLKQEESTSASIGFTAKLPEANIKITADAYYIAIEDRITYTDTFDIPAGISTNAESAAFFTNAIDTESKGIDIIITHNANLGNDITLKSDLSATFSQTRKVDDTHFPQKIADSPSTADDNAFFSEQSRIYLEESVPRTKLNLSNTLSVGRFNVFLRNVYFGKVTEASNDILSQQVYSSKVVTDLSVGFEATDNLRVTIGANNLLDVYPDRTNAANSNFSSGRFEWSRRAQQFGIGGRFAFARLNFILK